MFVDCESHYSYYNEQYTDLTYIYSDNNDSLAPWTNMAILYHSNMPCEPIRIACHTHSVLPVSMILDFWTHNF